MVGSISLIIPSQNAEIKLHQLLSKVPEWKLIPNEIIIIDSSEKKVTIAEEFQLFTKKNNIKLLIIYGKNIFPGHARNIGISNSTNSLLAFLDTSTHPNNEWLNSGVNLINSKKFQGVWGNTYYEADTFISKVIRASTFGEKPIQTFPGSILHKSVFNRCGKFVEAARAGEDGDWMNRAELQKINMSHPEEYLKYDKLNHTSVSTLVKKWFRNYIYVANLPFFRAHKDVYYLSISFLAILIAFNWNWILAAWDMNSILYIPNITKISISVILIAYVLGRGILLPIKKSINLIFLFQANFIFITLLSMILDITKVLAFIYSKLFRS